MELLASRRMLLLGAGGALIVGFTLGRRAAEIAGEIVASASKSVATNEVDSYLAVSADGKVTVFSGKVDLGTGIETALTQMVADELDIPMDRVSVVQGDTLLTPDQGLTWGSLSIQVGGMQLRQAAATARTHLLALAAQRLGMGADELVVVDGVVRPKAGGGSVTYGDLLGNRLFDLKLDNDAISKDPASFGLVGKPVRRLDIAPKVFGRFTFMQDYKVDGMLHGRVVRPPAIGAELQDFDEVSVQGILGVVKVVREGNFLAVVAETEWAAVRAARALKATWSEWTGLPEQAKLWDYVRTTKVARHDVTRNTGDVQTVLAHGGRQIAATYEFPMHTHGSIGPSCAIAALSEGKLTVWTASQANHQLRKELAAMMQMAPEAVRCLYVEGAGCYGRNGHEDAAADAALLTRAVGRPVRVQWSRADEHGWDPKGPPTLVDLHAALDANGNVTAWDSAFFVPEGAGPDVPLLAASLAGLPHRTALATGNMIINSAIPYDFPNVRTACHRLVKTPLRASWIRSPGRMQNTYANESFIDELAAAAGADPLAFRIRSLKDPRGIELLNRLAVSSKWEARPSPAKEQRRGDIAHGRGMSYLMYDLVRTYVGAVAEVEVNCATGVIRIRKVFIAHDCGQIINPDGVRNQIEGSVMQTTSRTLIEELAFDCSAVTSLDWASYPIITFPDVPVVATDLIDRPMEKPWGAGEPSAAVIPSAISNAVFDATGVRLRTVPFTPERMKASLR